VNILGLGAAVRQALDVGLEAIGQRAAALGARLRRQLAGLPDVTVHDLGRIRCAIVTAKVDGLAAEQAAQALARAGVNVSTTVPEDNPLDTQDRGVHPMIRFSPHYYNTEDEIDRATELVAALARLPAPYRTDLKPRPARSPGSDRTHPGRTDLGGMPGAHGTLPGGVGNGRSARRR
jgi:selenocysteine lyase/cysteine desulfurase